MKFNRFNFLSAAAFFAAALPALAADTAALPAGAEAYTKTAITRVAAGASYIRLANLRDEPTRNYVEVYGLTDKATLGSFVVDVPAKASVQFQPETMIQTFAPVNWDQPLVLYVENGRDKQVWQHIKSYPGTGMFFDASACAAPPHMDYVQPGNVALNVFTGGLARYVSTVSIHNFSNKTGRYEARIYDAATGKKVGATAFELAPRQSLTRSGAYYAQVSDLNASVDASRYLNVEFVSVGDADARVVLSHEVMDVFNSSVLNLSNPCAIHGGFVSAF
jgi:hypothetical protein